MKIILALIAIQIIVNIAGWAVYIKKKPSPIYIDSHNTYKWENGENKLMASWYTGTFLGNTDTLTIFDSKDREIRSGGVMYFDGKEILENASNTPQIAPD